MDEELIRLVKELLAEGNRIMATVHHAEEPFESLMVVDNEQFTNWYSRVVTLLRSNNLEQFIARRPRFFRTNLSTCEEQIRLLEDLLEEINHH